MTQEQPSDAEVELERVREWKRVGLALVAASTAVEAMLVAKYTNLETPHG